MSTLQTLCGAVLGIMLSTDCTVASEALEHRFATCAGRLSAELEHHWLMRDPRADDTERVRDTMVDLFDAVASEADRPRLMAIRINAKSAHRALLQRAAFNQQPVDADWAARRAESQREACSALLLM